MPRTRKRERPPAETPAPVPNEILDQFAPDRPLSAAEVEAATRRFKKALIERALGAELSHHLGHPPGGARPDAATNHRSGSSGKTVITDDGTVDIAVTCRDREGTFEPQLIPKHDRRFTGFEDKDLAGPTERHRDVGGRGAIVAARDEPIRHSLWRSLHAAAE